MKKKNLFILIFLFLSPFILGNIQEKDGEIFSEQPTFWILSDPHFLTTELHDQGQSIQDMQKTSAGKDIFYQEESWELLLKQAKKDQPDALIITGDLTFNGEKKSAEKLASYFAELEEYDIKTFVIPGNHDIYDGWAREYQDEQQLKTPQISPKEFQNIFYPSYEDAKAKDPSSLSYVVEATPQFQFLFLDTNVYASQTSNQPPETRGELSKNSLSWIKKQLKKAQNNKKTTLVFMHHNLFKHNELVYKGFVLDNASELESLLSSYQVPMVFSGHIHAQDILQGIESSIIEITTGSFAIAPQVIGELRLNSDKIAYQRLTLDTSSNTELQLDEYMKNLFIHDGEQLADQTLLQHEVYEEIRIPIAKLVGQINYQFFAGEDYLTTEEVAKWKDTEGCQLLVQQKVPFLLDYLESIIQDTNLPDTELLLEKERVWKIINQ